MSILIVCECGRKLHIKDEHAGKRGKCPACGRSMDIPNPRPSTEASNPPESGNDLTVQTEIRAIHEELDSDEIVSAPEPPKTLIDKYREDYYSALSAIENDVKSLIEQGKEMQGLMLLHENVVTIGEIRESLETFYSLLFNNSETLKRFGSERLKQLGHEPLLIRECAADWGMDTEELEEYVMKQFKKLGIAKKHWWLKDVVVTEVEYMLDALQILIEPEFIPLVEETEDEALEKPDRYVPPAVKLAVWRRDRGKCVQCSSKEKLEYDHIIPVSKGGSNTERNVQLLCEKCNREKAAKIA